jgi:hypothetical protein
MARGVWTSFTATAKLSRIEEIVSFDSRQRNLALAVILKVGP